MAQTLTKNWTLITALLEAAEEHSVPRRAKNAKYRVAEDHDVNHAENSVWFPSKHTAQDFARVKSQCVSGSWSVWSGATASHTYIDGQEGK